MRERNLKILSWIYIGAAGLSLVICVWNVIVGGLFAPAVDIRGGIGVAMVCTLAELALCALTLLIALDMRKKFTAKTFKMGLLLLGLSLFTLIFLLIGGYNILPPLFGILLPAATLFFIR